MNACRRKATFKTKVDLQEKTKTRYKGKKFDISKVRCFNCQKLGHFAKDCRSKKKKDFKGKHHASTSIEEEEDSRKKSKGSSSNQDRKKDYHLGLHLLGV